MAKEGFFVRMQMKKLVCLVLTAVLLALTASASAEMTLNNRKLTNKALLKPIKATEYADWTLYQPEDREIPVDVTKVSQFKKYPYFPVLAVKNDETAVLLLKRTGKSWTLVGANRNVLTREGWTLWQFTMDHMIGNENEAMFIGFYFTAEDGGSMELFLQPFAGSRRFSFISFTPAASAAENLFAHNVDIMFNSGLKYSYREQATQNTWTYSMDSKLPLAAEYDNFDVFDLSQVPLTIMEAMVPVTVTQDTVLRQFPGESAALAGLSAGDEVLAAYDSWDYQYKEWVLAWNGSAMGYISRVSFASDTE